MNICGRASLAVTHVHTAERERERERERDPIHKMQLQLTDVFFVDFNKLIQ